MATTEPLRPRMATPLATRTRPARPRWRQALLGVRTRILVGFIALMVTATFLSGFIMRQILLTRLDERISADLAQEVSELRQLVGGRYPDGTCVTDLDGDGRCDVGRDPETGEPFGDDIRAIFETFLQRNLPAEEEALLAFVGGEPFRVSDGQPPHQLLSDERFRRLGSVTDGPVRGQVHMESVGTVRYLAVPIIGSTGTTLGVFVVATFVDLLRADVQEATRAAAIAGVSMLAIASMLAFFVAGRVLAPVRSLTHTARSISDSDLSGRISVEGRDELAELAMTFNEMLDRLEDAFAAQRSFIDDAGHELRTPITIIRGHLELLGDDPHERQETVALVTDELGRMSRMVDDLLTLAKAERPDFLSLGIVDVEHLTADLHAKASALAKRRWRLESVGRGLVVADRQRLTQAVMQLAQNAAQHTAFDDEIALGSRVGSETARLWVRDSGAGVAPTDAGRIFNRFARAAASRRRSEGAGLGLSIVRAIAEAHGGEVALDSRPGQGATFMISIPILAPVDSLPDAREQGPQS